MSERLALFPLEIVLLPGERRPLHIFEPRYRLLVRRVLQQQERMGINLLLQERFYPVGCVAELEHVLRRYRDGRFDISVIGRERYRARTVDESSQPYWVAEVEWLYDDPEPVAPSLRRECERLYDELLLLVRGRTPEVQYLLEEAHRTERLSFYLGTQLGLEPLQRQNLLELPSEQRRLQWLHQYLSHLVERLHEMEALIRRIRSNGHFPR